MTHAYCTCSQIYCKFHGCCVSPDIALLVIPSEQERSLGACVVLRWAVTLGGIVVPLAIKVLSCSSLVAELFRAQTAKASTNIAFPRGIRRVWEPTFVMCLPPSHTHTHTHTHTSIACFVTRSSSFRNGHKTTAVPPPVQAQQILSLTISHLLVQNLSQNCQSVSESVCWE